MESPGSEDQSTPRELPSYARVEDITRYCEGGFHPIHLGDHIGIDDRFEVHHKLGYSDAYTVWLCLDRKNGHRVGVKVFQAEKSVESHPEIAALRLFEGVNRQELQLNHIFTIDEHFWIDGPNGRHLCFVVPVLGPAISYTLRGIDLDTPDLLTDLCLQAAQTLKYLHDKKICHGDFRPDHMKMQLDSDAMSSIKIYDLFGEPKVWHLSHSQESNGRRPRYLAEPANIASLEAKYRTGKIAIDSFSDSYREGDITEPSISDNDYAAPELRFLNKRHAWAYGPFPQDYWKEIGEYLSSDSAVPVFTVNPIPQKPQIEIDPYSREWGMNREGVVAVLLGDEETPRSIRQRKMLQDEMDRSKYLRIKLPKNSNVWTKFQEQRKRYTSFHSLLHEDLSKERQWYQDTDRLNGIYEYIPERLPGVIDNTSLQHLNSTWDLESSSEGDRAEAPEGQLADMDMTSKDTNKSPKGNQKRALEDDQDAQPNPKKTKRFVTEHNLRDLVERTEQNDGMTKFSYRLQPVEVNLLASLLRDMLKNDPSERIGIDEVLQHKWFDTSRKRLA
ncbi:hypothetical protein ONZ43_g5497 [Nemania bipapillata]|uniref:Uncharacterized protein n=1 Tax=Nemania bipapillata TaxID=110536 RepID=A0ACC2IA00_9PEZI|nr:hypothetical protein ONZ43_g5497 [Nemania bipapillata]